MINHLTLINLSQDINLESTPDGQVFYLQTCQRQMLVGLEKSPFQFLPEGTATDSFSPESCTVIEGQEAYNFLLETLCGLKSRLVGESEIVGQFRQAFKSFLGFEQREKALIPLFEKLLKDGKEIRTRYLRDISQLSYSGLARQCLQKEVQNGPIAILGSGQMAEDLIKVLGKKYQILLCARNQNRIATLSQKESVTALPFDQLTEVYKTPYIINTIPSKIPFITKEKLQIWQQHNQSSRMLIDLSSPSAVDTDYHDDSAIKLLADLFDLGENISNLKDKKVEQAKSAITELSLKRCEYFKINFPLRREDLKFA